MESKNYKKKFKKGNINMKNLLSKLMLKKSKGEQNMLVVLGLCVVGTFLLIIFKDSATDIINSLTKSVGDTIKGVFNGI